MSNIGVAVEMGADAGSGGPVDPATLNPLVYLRPLYQGCWSRCGTGTITETQNSSGLAHFLAVNTLDANDYVRITINSGYAYDGDWQVDLDELSGTEFSITGVPFNGNATGTYRALGVSVAPGDVASTTATVGGCESMDPATNDVWGQDDNKRATLSSIGFQWYNNGENDTTRCPLYFDEDIQFDAPIERTIVVCGYYASSVDDDFCIAGEVAESENHPAVRVNHADSSFELCFNGGVFLRDSGASSIRGGAKFFAVASISASSVTFYVDDSPPVTVSRPTGKIQIGAIGYGTQEAETTTSSGLLLFLLLPGSSSAGRAKGLRDWALTQMDLLFTDKEK